MRINKNGKTFSIGFSSIPGISSDLSSHLAYAFDGIDNVANKNAVIMKKHKTSFYVCE